MYDDSFSQDGLKRPMKSIPKFLKEIGQYGGYTGRIHKHQTFIFAQPI